MTVPVDCALVGSDSDELDLDEIECFARGGGYEREGEMSNNEPWRSWPVCRTCGKPYVAGEMTFCSSNFHCCRDCEWKWPEGFIVKTCEPCKAENERIMSAWLAIPRDR